MAIRVLIVDDSGFFRRRLTEIFQLDPLIEVIDYAADGQEAIDKVKSCHPDVITMDVEMPVMNGIDATRQIMKECPTPILMFSSLTYAGAQATLDALEAGATDFLPKRFDDISSDRVTASRILCARVKALAMPRRESTLSSQATRQKPVVRSPEPATTSSAQVTPANRPRRRRAFIPEDYDVVAIGTSTGGPIALQEVLTRLPARFPLPLLLVQHMPAKFTEAFASRLNQMCMIEVREAKNGDELQPGVALLAPGGLQMKLEKRAGRLLVRVEEEEDQLQNYRPCVDVTFNSINKATGSRTLAIILTGMGSDGQKSCNLLKSTGATIWAQDQRSSTIYGMPGAVSNIADQILSLNEIASKLAEPVSS